MTPAYDFFSTVLLAFLWTTVAVTVGYVAAFVVVACREFRRDRAMDRHAKQARR